MVGYEELERTLTELLRMEEFPVGWKFVEDESELSEMLRPKKKVYSCQMMKIASQGGFVLAATDKELACRHERLAFDMEPLEDTYVQSIQMRYVKDKEVAKKWLLEMRPTLKKRRRGIIVGPLSKVPFTPDIIILTVNAWQATRCIHAYAYHDGENLNFMMGLGALPCAYGAVYVYNTGKPNLVTACSGAREWGKFERNDLSFFMPFKDANRFVEGLKATHGKGLRVPMFLDLGYPPKPARAVFENDKGK